jgi:hypothetical protein
MVLGMFFLMTLLFVFTLGDVMFYTGWLDPFAFIMIGVIYVAALSFLGLLGFLSKREFRKAVSDSALVEGDAITLPLPRSALLFAKARPSIPLAEVLAVRRYLEPFSWGSSAHVETVGGEDMEVPTSVFESLRGRTGFEREGFFIRNTRPYQGAVLQVVATAWHRALVLFLSIILLQFTMAFFGESWGERIFEGEAADTVMYSALLVVFLVLIPIRLIMGGSHRGTGSVTASLPMSMA